MSDTVAFDPGIGTLVKDLYSFYQEMYFKLSNLRSLQQKRTFFKLYAPKLENHIKNNIYFYALCLMWAYYIVNSNKDNPKEISGNIFYNADEYDYIAQIHFINAVLSSLERDYSYYTGKKYIISSVWKNILAMYNEFLLLNKGFINLKMTCELMLPEKLLNMQFCFDINELINKVIEEKNFYIFSQLEIFA